MWAVGLGAFSTSTSTAGGGGVLVLAALQARAMMEGSGPEFEQPGAWNWAVLVLELVQVLVSSLSAGLAGRVTIEICCA